MRRAVALFPARRNQHVVHVVLVPKLVVSMDPVIGAGQKGIHHVHIREFLLTEW